MDSEGRWIVGVEEKLNEAQSDSKITVDPLVVLFNMSANDEVFFPYRQINKAVRISTLLKSTTFYKENIEQWFFCCVHTVSNTRSFLFPYMVAENVRLYLHISLTHFTLAPKMCYLGRSFIRYILYIWRHSKRFKFGIG